MAQRPPPLKISPPLLNSANPWATTIEDIRGLYACQSTGAVTTRTALLTKGFQHEASKHDFAFLDSATHRASKTASVEHNASINCFGYSPFPLEQYLDIIKTIDQEQNHQPGAGSKYFLVSVTGDPDEVASCYKFIATAQKDVRSPLAMEINLSCPNIVGKTPPAYSRVELVRYLDALQNVLANKDLPRIPFGLKTPPYTHSQQFKELSLALEGSKVPGESVSPISFITATNTLGNCMLLDPVDAELGLNAPTHKTTLPGLGLGGLAGAPLHPLALGNVSTLRKLLDESGLDYVQVIGIGGVLDADGYKRMRHAGASVVGVGTGLGLKGVEIFKEIEKQLEGKWERG